METDSAFTQIRYDKPSERIARIVLSRADKRNAQDMKMLYEINAGLDRATQDDQVRVIILAADGPDFSSSHDLAAKASRVGNYAALVTGTGGFGLAGPEGYFAREQEVFLGFCWQWRNLPKPVIVAPGKFIALYSRCVKAGGASPDCLSTGRPARCRRSPLDYEGPQCDWRQD